jgi:von Willebrand factor type A domain/Aerotolerance regulator N-terminal
VYPIDFANPLGWWWAVAALPIIGFYILKVRLRRQPVSTFLFWDRVFDEKKPRSWWQQLRHWLSLVLQLALLVFLVGALVDPLWSWQKNQKRKIVLVIDNSASMAVVENGETRLDQAKKIAAALVRSLRVDDEMAVITSGGKSTVAIGLTSHAGSLLDAINQVAVTDGPTALHASVEMAKRLVPESDQTKIAVLTDGCDPVTVQFQTDNRITMYGFGNAQDNLAITQFQVRRSLLDAIGYQVLIEVTNFGKSSQECRLELDLEGSLVDVIPIELEAGASKTLNLDQSSAIGGRLVAKLDIQDAMVVDNRALAVLPTRRKMPITLVTPGSVFLKSVFESIPLVDLTIQEMPPESWSTTLGQILVLHQIVPQQLPAGKLLVINPRDHCDLWKVGEVIETPLVSFVDEESPVTKHVRLTNVLFPEARAIDFQVDIKPLIKTPLDETLLCHIRRPSGDILVLNVDLDQGDLPLRIAFPVLMKNAVEWFQGNQGELQPALATGQSTTVQLPIAKIQPGQITPDEPSPSSTGSATGAIEVVSAKKNDEERVDLLLQSPSGKTIPLAYEQSTAMISQLTECGLWTIGTRADLDSATRFLTNIEDLPLVRLACNLCNREESDLTPRVALQTTDSLGMVRLGGRSIWFYLALIGLIIGAVEWWLYQRRVIG